MRILIFNTYYYPTFVGGAEISVQVLAEGLVKKGDEVFVVAFGKAYSVQRVNGVIVIYIKQRNVYSYFNTGKHSKFKKLLWHLIDSSNPFYYSFVKKLLKKLKPDIVHTNNILGFSASVWSIIKTNNIPLLHTIRDYYLLCHRCNLFNEGRICQKLCKDCKITHMIKHNFLEYPDGFIGISDFVLRKHDHLIDNDKFKQVIYNGVNCNGLTASDPISGKMIFGYLGRLNFDKGVEYMLTELANCNVATRRGFQLLLAGKGDDEFVDYLKSLCTDIDVVFLGIVDPDLLFGKIDMLIVPSLWAEPFGRTVIEAFSHSVPVCMSDNGGLKELYNENCSWVFTPKENELRNLLERKLISKETIAKKKQYCLENVWQYSQDIYVESYQDAYNKIISAGSLIN